MTDTCEIGDRHRPAKRTTPATVWLEMAVLVLLAAFLAFSYFAGRVKYFLAPEFVWLPLATSAALVAMAAARLWSKDHGQPGCDCHEEGVRQLPQSLCAVTTWCP